MYVVSLHGLDFAVCEDSPALCSRRELFQIPGYSDVTLTFRGKTFNEVHVIQTGADLLRANDGPVLRSASAKQDGWGGIRTPGAFRHTRFPGVHNQPLCHPSRTIFRFL